MKTVMVSMLVLLAGPGLAQAGPRVPMVDQLLRSQGELAFSDGASVYRLLKDHTFKLAPAGMSGRAIEGTWRRKDAFFVITGRWSWINVSVRAAASLTS